jgi:hypothetical protein
MIAETIEATQLHPREHASWINPKHYYSSQTFSEHHRISQHARRIKAIERIILVKSEVGFVSSRLTEELLNHGRKVTTLDNFSNEK